MKKILYIGKTYPEDRTAWSGTVYQTIQGLKRAGYEVDYLRADRDYQQSFMNKLLVTYWLRVPRLFGKNIRMDESFYDVMRYKSTLRNFDFSPYDVVFIDTYISIVCALPKNLKAKVVFLTDATMDSLFGYYTEFSNLMFHNYWASHYIAKKAFRRSDLLIVSSDWCRNNAVNQYGCNPDKIRVIEFGANIDLEDIPALPKQIDGKRHYNIYWSGVNWVRKGGDIALECCEELLRQGYDITLNITGLKQLPAECYDGNGKQKAYIKSYGFLNKNERASYEQLIAIMKEQDIFLFPSKAECAGIVLCEASGFGIPCYAYHTGGTPNYVVNGENGYVHPLNSGGGTFAHSIIESIRKRELDKLSLGAVTRYKEHLNWEVWSRKVRVALDSLE